LLRCKIKICHNKSSDQKCKAVLKKYSTYNRAASGGAERIIILKDNGQPHLFFEDCLSQP